MSWYAIDILSSPISVILFLWLQCMCDTWCMYVRCTMTTCGKVSGTCDHIQLLCKLCSLKKKGQIGPATVKPDYTQNNHQLPQWSVAQCCNLLNANSHFTEAEASPSTVICKDNHPLAFDTNQMPLKGHRRKWETDRQEEKEMEKERQKKKDRRGQTKSERQRLILSLGQLAAFQVITQVLPFSLSLALLLPLEVILTAHTSTHTHTTHKAQTVWAHRGTYIHLQSSL